MLKKRVLPVIVILLLALQITNSQLLGLFTSVSGIGGGPIVGWHFNKIDVLNTELKNAGFPQLSKNGFFTLGAGGFIDLAMFKNSSLRIGGMGIGFNSNISSVVNDSLTKAVNYGFGMGGLSVEYVKSFHSLDLIAGAEFTTGTLKIDLYQYGKDYGNYNPIFGEFANNSSSQNITRNFKLRFWAVQPQVSVAYTIKNIVYLKLTGGYLLSTGSSWKVDNDVTVTNFPSGIKPDGFTVNLSINAGFFFTDK